MTASDKFFVVKAKNWTASGQEIRVKNDLDTIFAGVE